MIEPGRSYKIKEIHFTVQGEGYHSGKAAIFIRFSGCNLWNGRESSRQIAICQFCDTDFVGIDGHMGGRYTAKELLAIVMKLWPKASNVKPFVVLTGGEPALQLDSNLIRVFHEENIYVAVETNGTMELPAGIDWICMSPKAGSLVVLRSGDELKVVYPQAGMDPEEYYILDFEKYYLQPKAGSEVEDSTQQCLTYIRRHPHWQLSLQIHKYLDIP